MSGTGCNPKSVVFISVFYLFVMNYCRKHALIVPQGTELGGNLKSVNSRLLISAALSG